MLWAYRDRMEDLKKDPRFQYALIFKNEGMRPARRLSTRIPSSSRFRSCRYRCRRRSTGQTVLPVKERCIFCDIIRQELNSGTRIVSENRDFVALEPFTPRFPFEPG